MKRLKSDFGIWMTIIGNDDLVNYMIYHRSRHFESAIVV